MPNKEIELLKLLHRILTGVLVHAEPNAKAYHFINIITVSYGRSCSINKWLTKHRYLFKVQFMTSNHIDCMLITTIR